LSQALLSIRGADKLFGSLRAVNSVDLDIGPGEIIGLIGPNGSGKTTLVNLISGADKMDAGRIVLDDQDATRWSPQRRCRWGIGRTRQIARPLRHMTVYENVMVGALFGSASFQASSRAHAIVEHVLDDVGLSAVAHAYPTDLPIQKLKLLEMARALATQPRVLLLDETIAGLSAGEAKLILDLMARKRDEGLGIVFIEHRLPEVIRMSNRVVVLNSGSVLAEGDPVTISQDPAVMSAYLGIGGAPAAASAAPAATVSA
jgi:ABC-type branched-subunit amino acid transport system ATPase component